MKKIFLSLLAFSSTAGFCSKENCAGSKFFIGIDLGSPVSYYDSASKGASLLENGSNIAPEGPLPNMNNLYENYFNTVRSAWGTPGITGLLSLGYDCKFSGSNLVGGIFVAGGVSKMSTQLPYQAIEFIQNKLNPNSYQGIPIQKSIHVSTYGSVRAGLRMGISSERFLYIANIGWSSFKQGLKLSVMQNSYDNAAVANVGLAKKVEKKLSKWSNCLMVGGGLEYNLSSNWVVGFMGNVHIGRKVKYTFKEGTFTDLGGLPYTPIFETKMRAYEVLMNIKWAFPTCR